MKIPCFWILDEIIIRVIDGDVKLPESWYLEKMESTTIRQRVGDNVRRLRHERQLTAEQAVKRMKALGFSWTASRISELEAGSKSVSLAELVGLAYALSDHDNRVTLEDLFVGRGAIELTESMGITTRHMLEILRGYPISHSANAYPRLRNKKRMPTGWPPEHITKPSDLLTGIEADGGTVIDSRIEQSAGAADDKAAKALGISRAVLLEAAAALWGRSVTEERELRAQSVASKQAKGHITRQLMSELRRYLGDFYGDN